MDDITKRKNILLDFLSIKGNESILGIASELISMLEKRTSRCAAKARELENQLYEKDVQLRSLQTSNELMSFVDMLTEKSKELNDSFNGDYPEAAKFQSNIAKCFKIRGMLSDIYSDSREACRALDRIESDIKVIEEESEYEIENIKQEKDNDIW